MGQAMETDLVVILPDAVARLVDVFCGCGDPEMAWEAVRDELVRLEDLHDKSKPEPAPLPNESGAWWVLIYLLHRLELTEHGGSVMFSWLTAAGRDVLQFLREYGVDWIDHEYIQFVDKEGCHRGGKL